MTKALALQPDTMLAARALDALGNDTRREIVALVRERPLTVGELAARLPVSRPAVSKHLKLLVDARLVEIERHGTRHVVRVAPEGFASVRSYLEAFWDEALARFALVAENTTPRAPKTRARASPSSKGAGRDAGRRQKGRRR